MPRMSRYLMTPKGMRGVLAEDEEVPDNEKEESKAMERAEKKAGKAGAKHKRPSLASMISSNYKPRKPR